MLLSRATTWPSLPNPAPHPLPFFEEGGVPSAGAEGCIRSAFDIPVSYLTPKPFQQLEMKEKEDDGGGGWGGEEEEEAKNKVPSLTNFNGDGL